MRTFRSLLPAPSVLRPGSASPSTLFGAARAWLARAGAMLPGSCALCGATGPHALCRGCREEYFPEPGPRCCCCALPLPPQSSQSSLSSSPALSPSLSDRSAAPLACGACVATPPAFDASIAAVDYAAPVDQLVLGLKFGGRLALAPLFADLIGAALVQRAPAAPAGTPSLHSLPELLMPVPLGPLRLQERGFNQALEIARPLALALGVPLAPRLLARVRDTAAQAMLSPLERRKNLKQAFSPAPGMGERIRGRHVGVIDDVMTTGETLDAVAATLKRFGAARVTNLVFARTLPN